MEPLRGSPGPPVRDEGVNDSGFRPHAFKRIPIEWSAAPTAPRRRLGSEANAGPVDRWDQPHLGKRLGLVAFDASGDVSTVIATKISLHSHDHNPFLLPRAAPGRCRRARSSTGRFTSRRRACSFVHGVGRFTHRGAANRRLLFPVLSCHDTAARGPCHDGFVIGARTAPFSPGAGELVPCRTPRPRTGPTADVANSPGLVPRSGQPIHDDGASAPRRGQ